MFTLMCCGFDLGLGTCGLCLVLALGNMVSGFDNISGEEASEMAHIASTVG